jgi:Zn-finger protein
MHELAKEIIKKRINRLIEEWDFERRRKFNPDECKCYQRNKKCHDLEDLNCLFCYCPHYDLSVEEGKCKINSPKGKYFENSKGKRLDCSNCDFPHKVENIRSILLKIYNFD